MKLSSALLLGLLLLLLLTSCVEQQPSQGAVDKAYTAAAQVQTAAQKKAYDEQLEQQKRDNAIETRKKEDDAAFQNAFKDLLLPVIGVLAVIILVALGWQGFNAGLLTFSRARFLGRSVRPDATGMFPIFERGGNLFNANLMTSPMIALEQDVIEALEVANSLTPADQIALFIALQRTNAVRALSTTPTLKVTKEQERRMLSKRALSDDNWSEDDAAAAWAKVEADAAANQGPDTTLPAGLLIDLDGKEHTV